MKCFQNVGNILRPSHRFHSRSYLAAIRRRNGERTDESTCHEIRRLQTSSQTLRKRSDQGFGAHLRIDCDSESVRVFGSQG